MRIPLPPKNAPRAATLVGEFRAVDEQESIRTLEVPVVPVPYATEEILVDDILEELVVAPTVASVLPPPVTPPRRTMGSSAPMTSRPRSIGPWIAGGVAIGVLVSLSVAVLARVVDTRTPYPRTHVDVVQAAGRSASTATPAAASPAKPPQSASGDVPSVRVDTLPIVPSTRGTLTFSTQAHGHRVYVDGVVLGESDGLIDVRCGKHAIKVGSHGDTVDVDVPCGSAILVK